MKKDKVSVIIPVYNANNTLKKCIDSLINQSYDNIEIIVIDDGSTDNSLEILNKYDNKNIKFISQKNRGVSAARNTGLKEVSGSFITFVDPDDYVDVDFVEYLHNGFKDNNVDLVICDYKYLKQDIDQKSNLIKQKIFSKSDALKEIIGDNGIFCGHVWDKMFKTSIINNLYFKENIHCFEDLLFCCEYIEKCDNNIIFLPEKKYNYIQHDMSILHKRYSYKYYSSLYALKKMKDIYLKNNSVDILNNLFLKEIVNQGIRCIKEGTFELKKRVCKEYLEMLEEYKLVDKSLKIRIKYIIVKTYFIIFNRLNYKK